MLRTKCKLCVVSQRFALMAGGAVALVSATALALDPWVWLDEHGQRVYSDRPPPPSVPAQRILHQPGRRLAPAPDNDANAQAATSPGTPGSAAAPIVKAPQPPQGDPARQRMAEQQRNEQIRADNCQRARAALAALQSGGRLVTYDAQGKRITMTPEMIAAEKARMEQVISENCR